MKFRPTLEFLETRITPTDIPVPSGVIPPLLPPAMPNQPYAVPDTTTAVPQLQLNLPTDQPTAPDLGPPCG